MKDAQHMKLNGFSDITSETISQAAKQFGTPVYVYDETLILKRCRQCLDMPAAFGLTVRYAMKSNSCRAVLQLVHQAGLGLDASSLNEVLRAHIAGIPYSSITLTTQEVYCGERLEMLQDLMTKGLNYNACSLRQLRLIADFAAAAGINPGIRIHPGIGSGESAARNTGDDYACFGVHMSDISEAIDFAYSRGLKFTHIHEHIGSGADPEVWRNSIDHELSIIEEYFPDADTVCFGGGLKEARMPGDNQADVMLLGRHAKAKIEDFYTRTGRKLHAEIEPGTYIVANSGYAVTRVIDKKRTSRSNFIVIDGGLEINPRPLFYGSKHPIYIIAENGETVKSSEFMPFPEAFDAYDAVVAGKCCESGDCQTLTADGHSESRAMAEPDIGDIAVIGGTGAYCAAMAPFNYNSHTQAPEVMYKADGQLQLVRRRQTLEQVLENEV